jgi:hypothetical protein
MWVGTPKAVARKDYDDVLIIEARNLLNKKIAEAVAGAEKKIKESFVTINLFEVSPNPLDISNNNKRAQALLFDYVSSMSRPTLYTYTTCTYLSGGKSTTADDLDHWAKLLAGSAARRAMELLTESTSQREP